MWETEFVLVALYWLCSLPFGKPRNVLIKLLKLYRPHKMQIYAKNNCRQACQECLDPTDRLLNLEDLPEIATSNLTVTTKLKQALLLRCHWLIGQREIEMVTCMVLASLGNLRSF